MPFEQQQKRKYWKGINVLMLGLRPLQIVHKVLVLMSVSFKLGESATPWHDDESIKAYRNVFRF